MEQFPLDIGLTELRGVIKVIKDNNNTIALSKLVAETGEEIDTLLPLLNAGRMLNLLTINNGIVTITESGKILSIKNIANIIGSQLALLEPFRTILEVLKEGNKTTNELVVKLNALNISLNVADQTSKLRTMLIKWGVRTKLVLYNRKKDEWSLYKI
jgi:hypothetical protein